MVESGGTMQRTHHGPSTPCKQPCRGSLTAVHFRENSSRPILHCPSHLTPALVIVLGLFLFRLRGDIIEFCRIMHCAAKVNTEKLFFLSCNPVKLIDWQWLQYKQKKDWSTQWAVEMTAIRHGLHGFKRDLDRFVEERLIIGSGSKMAPLMVTCWVAVS